MQVWPALSSLPQTSRGAATREVGIGVEDRRRLAAELQRHRRQVVRRSERDQRGPTVVEPVKNRWSQRRRANAWPTAASPRTTANSSSANSRETRFSQQRRRRRGQLRRLQQHAVAGGQRADRRRERELDRVVPRADDADHAQRLAQDAATTRAAGAAVSPRAACCIHCRRWLSARARLGGDEEELGQPRLVVRAMAEVLRHRRAQRLLVPMTISARAGRGSGARPGTESARARTPSRCRVNRRSSSVPWSRALRSLGAFMAIRRDEAAQQDLRRESALPS